MPVMPFVVADAGIDDFFRADVIANGVAIEVSSPMAFGKSCVAFLSFVQAKELALWLIKNAD